MSEDQNVDTSGMKEASVSVSRELKQIVEAMLFASDEPVSLQTLKVVFEEVNKDVADGEKMDPSNDDFRAAVASLNVEYNESGRSYRIKELAGGYVFATQKEYATWVGKLFKEKARRKLSQTAVESLAIIAYKQPITKSEVEFIRGVNCDYIMKTLLEKNLVTIVGRAHSPGRPLLYGTTPEFLKHFGLNEVADLPKPREIEELIGETELEVEKRMLADQQDIEFKEKLEEKFDPNSRAPHIPRKKSKLQEPPKEGEGKTIIEKVIQPPAPRPPVEEVPLVVDGLTEAPPQSTELPAIVAREAEQEIPRIPVVPEPWTPAATIVEPTDVEPPTAIEAKAIEPSIAPEPTSVDLYEEVTPNLDVVHAPSLEQYVAQPPSEAIDLNEPESKKGWSKWKTKIQTFFRTLFG